MPVTIAGRTHDFSQRPGIMGVINLSPDSWYRESVCLTADAAIRRGMVLKAQGADLIDIGAESSLAGAARANAAQQVEKLVPVVKGLRAEGVAVSVETYQPDVVRAALEAGASAVNLTGNESAEEIYRMAAAHEAVVILCFVRGANVREVGDLDLGADPIEVMRGYFREQIEVALRCRARHLILDAGLGFYYRNLQDSRARVRYQIDVFLNTFRLRTLGYPICHALPHAFQFFEDEVRSAEPFFAVLAALGKTDLFRTHEVQKVRAVIETLGAF